MHRELLLTWLSLILISPTFAFTLPKYSPQYTSHTRKPNTNLMSLKAAPISIVVECEIKADRIDDFLDVIEKDAVGSRLEPGCLRFDVLRDKENPCKFYFYEVYTDDDAVQIHKAQPHFALWTNFKNSGGVVSSVSHKAEGLFMDKL